MRGKGKRGGKGRLSGKGKRSGKGRKGEKSGWSWKGKEVERTWTLEEERRWQVAGLQDTAYG